LNFSEIVRVGMENITVNFYCNQISAKNVIVCHKTTVRT